MKKIFIELPSWLGDTLMATPAIENLIKYYGEVEISLFGSKISIEALKQHPSVVNTYVLDKNILSLYRFAQTFEEFDIFFSFRGSLRAKFIKFLIPSKRKYQFN